MLNHVFLQNLCRMALAEDIGRGDATTLAVIPEQTELTAEFRTRKECVCAGLPLAEAVFRELNRKICFTPAVKDGDRCAAGSVIAKVEGPARPILTGERTALNFLQRLSGIATLTSQYVAAAAPYKAEILDTRKTTPTLRTLEKYAVTMGGGSNHRFGLYDRIMIKDNHRQLAGLLGPNAIAEAVRRCREQYPHLEIEVEADTMDDVIAALEAGVEYVLLDNMDTDDMTQAVERCYGKALVEASGGVTLERIPEIAATGVDFISVGALTHSAAAVDIGLDLHLPPPVNLISH